MGNVEVNNRVTSAYNAIVASLKAVGIILSVAMLVAPGAIAFLLTKRYATMLVTAVAVAVTSSLSGIYLSFLIDSAPAPTIVLLMTILFILAFFRNVLQSRRPAQEA